MKLLCIETFKHTEVQTRHVSPYIVTVQVRIKTVESLGKYSLNLKLFIL